MTKTKTILIAAFAAVAVAIGVTTAVLVNQPAQTQTTNTSQQAPAEDNKNLVTFTAEAGKTVLDQLKAIATVETKESSFGVYVDSINGIVGGTDGKYWTFYVNDTMAQIGAAEYVTDGGEKIDWKFE